MTAFAPDTLVGVPMALALGLAYGLGPCLISCLPYLGPVFLARDFGVRRSWRVVLPLALGRLTGYGGFGLAAGVLGHSVRAGASAPLLRWLVGGAALMVGLALLWRRSGCAAHCAAEPAAGAVAPVRRLERSAGRSMAEPRPLLPGGLFLMGVSMTMTPCAPLGVVLFSAATAAGAGAGLALGLAFGLGAIVVPTLVYGVLAAYLGQRLRQELAQWLPWLEYPAAGLLIAVGLLNVLR